MSGWIWPAHKTAGLSVSVQSAGFHCIWHSLVYMILASLSSPSLFVWRLTFLLLVLRSLGAKFGRLGTKNFCSAAASTPHSLSRCATSSCWLGAFSLHWVQAPCRHRSFFWWFADLVVHGAAHTVHVRPLSLGLFFPQSATVA